MILFNKYVNFWQSIVCNEKKKFNKFSFKAFSQPIRKFIELSKISLFLNNSFVLQNPINKNNMISVKTEIMIPFEFNKKNWIFKNKFFEKKIFYKNKLMRDWRVSFLKVVFFRMVELEIENAYKYTKLKDLKSYNIKNIDFYKYFFLKLKENFNFLKKEDKLILEEIYEDFFSKKNNEYDDYSDFSSNFYSEIKKIEILKLSILKNNGDLEKFLNESNTKNFLYFL